MISRRAFIAAASAAPMALTDQGEYARDIATVQRLSWAGVRIENAATSLFIDPWISPAIWDGAWTRPIIPLESASNSRFVLLTHIHNDHFDPAAIKQLIADRGFVVCHERIADYVSSRGIKVLPLRLFEPRTLGAFTVAPVPAVDGLGEDQVMWIVSAAGRRLLHGGDTMWHGFWWTISDQYSPFDAALLPINGVRLDRKLRRSEVAASMTAEQAVAAAYVLGAKMLLPIHYGFDNPPAYRELPNAVESALEHGRARGVPVTIIPEGGILRWTSGGLTE